MDLTHKNFISNNKYTVRLARDEADLEAAQRLRYRIFNIELGEGFEASADTRLDSDEFDMQCHHLLVISRADDEVIGTYRMQTFEIAKKGNGYYTAQEYNLSGIPKPVLEASVEVGRACIDAAHRNGRVLFLLWRGLAKYLMHFDKQYLFGCCSLSSQSTLEAWIAMKYLSEHDYLHEKLMIPATEKYSCEEIDTEPHVPEGYALPQLFRLYIELGAKVCSRPALDRSFKTIDFLVLLDVSKLDERTRMLFFN